MGMSGDNDEFGDRMKAYEAVETSRTFERYLPIYARIDGRSFSRLTRSMRRPFDPRMAAAMVGTTKALVKETHARIGYTQSDEISLAWLCDKPDAEPLFGGKVQKLTSVLASFSAAAFQQELLAHFGETAGHPLASELPHFDCRVFQLPNTVEATNAFLWRAMDARKNSVSMAARAHFSAKALFGKDQRDMRAMMLGAGTDFETAYPPYFKWGTWVRRVTVDRAMTAEELSRIPEKHRPAPDKLITRSEVRTIEMPEFHKVANRVEVIFDGADPVVKELPE